MRSLDIRDVSIIDSFPLIYAVKPLVVLTVGCGEARIEQFIAAMPDMKVIATDIKKFVKYEDNNDVTFRELDILNPPAIKGDVVICAQVLEHILEWKKAFTNLISLANTRLIVTVPYKASFHSPDHFNFWNDATVREFIHIANPFSTAISRIRTKPADAPNKGCFLIVVDKKQKYGI